MNYSATILEMAVVALGLGLLLLDLWTPLGMKRQLGYAAAAALGFVLLFSFSSFIDAGVTVTAFKGMYVQDGLALFFKRFFLVAAIIVLLMSVEFADRIQTGIAARAGRTGVQDCRVSIANLGAGCLPGIPRAHDRFSRGRLESGGFRSASACALQRRAGHHRALDETAHDHFGDHDSLWEPLRHSAAEPETPARLLQHIERRLHAPGRCVAESGWPVRRALLSGRLPVHRAGRVHCDLPGHAAGGRRRHQRAGRVESALPVPRLDDDPGDGLSGGHS